MKRNSLPEIMIKRADADGLPDDHEIRKAANDLEGYISDYVKDRDIDKMRKMMGAWARARRLWCLYSGEPLI